MKKTIFNVYVVMDSQETCGRMKAICLENGLPIWGDEAGWIYYGDGEFFNFDLKDEEFFVFVNFKNLKDKTQVTEAEFLELLNEYKLNK